MFRTKYGYSACMAGGAAFSPEESKFIHEHQQELDMIYKQYRAAKRQELDETYKRHYEAKR